MKLSRYHQEEDEDTSAFWLITYCDMTTLLLAFFLLIYAFTVLSAEKQQALLDALNVVGKGGQAIPRELQKAQLESTAQEIAKLLGEDQDEKPWVDADEAEVTIGLPASITFASGRAELTPEAAGHLRQAALLLKAAQSPIRVEGHTDNIPMAGGAYPSNWHLSVARAQTVLKLLMEAGIEPRQLQVVGYADTRPRAGNDSDDGRRANRRIELKLIRVDGSGARKGR